MTNQKIRAFAFEYSPRNDTTAKLLNLSFVIFLVMCVTVLLGVNNLWAQSAGVLKMETESVSPEAANVLNIVLEKSSPLEASKDQNKRVDVTIIETEIMPSQMVPAFAVPPEAKPETKTAAPSPRSPHATDSPFSKVEIQAPQISQINQSLRRMIEENEKLRLQNEEMDRNLRTLRGQRKLEENRVTAAVQERDQLKKEIQEIARKNSEFQKNMRTLEDALTAKEEWLNNKLRESPTAWSLAESGTLNAIATDIPQAERTLELLRYDMTAARDRLQKLETELPAEGVEGQSQELEADLRAAQQMPHVKADFPAPRGARKVDVKLLDGQGGSSKEAPAVSRGAAGTPLPPVDDGPRVKEVMRTLDEISMSGEKMRSDEAKVHYNMGNKIFYAGDYAKAAEEYRKAVELEPQNANAHFNLAYVSGEFLKDFKGAQEHYRQYLQLNPAAPDVNLVKEKIIEAELILRAMLDKSFIENDWKAKRNEIYTR